MDLNGVDVAWVRAELQQFVDTTVRVPEVLEEQSGSVRRSIRTGKMVPGCGVSAALQYAETIRAILNRLYPEWRSENSGDGDDIVANERNAASRLLGRLGNRDELLARLGEPDPSPRITASSLHHLIWDSAKVQWSTGHRHEAVLAAAKAVNSALQTKIGRRDVSESDLVKQAFSDKAPEAGKPRLRFTAIADEQTAKSMQAGVLEFGSGCFRAIRNPVGHLPNDEVELDEQTALERLAALSLFARWVDEATVQFLQ
ncbi:TIGR02391 family protein [Nocardia takedensis]|uniref:TIGR02391 family protein n=1 Tax=Nocardia takedensis TaxID=259390 RepID=UPI0012F6F40B|nr:TIGR02391 family protein [Nocardia takedensis]